MFSFLLRGIYIRVNWYFKVLIELYFCIKVTNVYCSGDAIKEVFMNILTLTWYFSILFLIIFTELIQHTFEIFYSKLMITVSIKYNVNEILAYLM